MEVQPDGAAGSHSIENGILHCTMREMKCNLLVAADISHIGVLGERVRGLIRLGFRGFEGLWFRGFGVWGFVDGGSVVLDFGLGDLGSRGSEVFRFCRFEDSRCSRPGALRCLIEKILRGVP